MQTFTVVVIDTCRVVASAFVTVMVVTTGYETQALLGSVGSGPSGPRSGIVGTLMQVSSPHSVVGTLASEVGPEIADAQKAGSTENTGEKVIVFSGSVAMYFSVVSTGTVIVAVGQGSTRTIVTVNYFVEVGLEPTITS